MLPVSPCSSADFGRPISSSMMECAIMLCTSTPKAAPSTAMIRQSIIPTLTEWTFPKIPFPSPSSFSFWFLSSSVSGSRSGAMWDSVDFGSNGRGFSVSSKSLSADMLTVLPSPSSIDLGQESSMQSARLLIGPVQIHRGAMTPGRYSTQRMLAPASRLVLACLRTDKLIDNFVHRALLPTRGSPITLRESRSRQAILSFPDFLQPVVADSGPALSEWLITGCR